HLMGIALNTFDQGSNSLGGFSGTLCQQADFIGDNSETASMFTCHSGLNGCIECQQVSLISDIFNDTYNFTDLIRTFTKTFNLLGCFLYVLADTHHTFNRLMHRLLTGSSIFQRILSCFHTRLSITCHVLNEISQRFHCFGGLSNLFHLSFRCMRKVSRAIENTASSVCHLYRGGLDTTDHLRKLLNHIIERVSQNAERIRSHFSLYTQIAITNCTHLLQEFLNLSL